MEKAEKFFIKEITKLGLPLKQMLVDLSVGEVISMMRKQLGMTQRILASKAKIPQPTLSRIEGSKHCPDLVVLYKIFNAISCDLILLPVLRISIEDQKKQQAKQMAEKHIQYLKGTMGLEGQNLDSEFIEELRKGKEEELLRSKRLWKEKYD